MNYMLLHLAESFSLKMKVKNVDDLNKKRQAFLLCQPSNVCTILDMEVQLFFPRYIFMKKYARTDGRPYCLAG